jgi:hypothetical protein
MIGVFIGNVRIGSILKFPHLKLPWVAYAAGDKRESFKTRKEAAKWLTEQHEAAVGKKP